MKSLPTIYKYATTGKEQQWQIFVDGDTYYTEAGQVGGKITKSKPTKCKAKNVGKANATTPEEQALLEAVAKRKLKLEKGYAESLETLKTKSTPYKPMLAHEYEKRLAKNKVTFPAVVQRKFDGIRCIMTKDASYTRNGKIHLTIPHIEESLKPFFEANPGAMLDGELYNHDLRHNFNKISSLIRKKKPTADQLAESKEKVFFYVYDAPKIGDLDENAPYQFRYDLIELIDSPYVRIVENINVTSHNDVIEYHDLFVEDGYEGAIVRKLNSPYKNGRSNDLLKYKAFDDDEFTLLDIREGKGNKKGIAAHADCITVDGKKFTANISGTEEYRKDLLENRELLIGEDVTIRYFRLTPDGIPRFPYLHTVRDYE
jgi:DNA ligase-1